MPIGSRDSSSWETIGCPFKSCRSHSQTANCISCNGEQAAKEYEIAWRADFERVAHQRDELAEGLRTPSFRLLAITQLIDCAGRQTSTCAFARSVICSVFYSVVAHCDQRKRLWRQTDEAAHACTHRMQWMHFERSTAMPR